jgi:hypothetical protein
MMNAPKKYVIDAEPGERRCFHQRQRLFALGPQRLFQLDRGELPQSSRVGITELL